MGRRRTVGESRSAGSGRRCRHPKRALLFQAGDGNEIRAHCTRCGIYLLGVDARPAPPRDARWALPKGETNG
jgi:hypothetical protein